VTRCIVSLPAQNLGTHPDYIAPLPPAMHAMAPPAPRPRSSYGGGGGGGGRAARHTQCGGSGVWCMPQRDVCASMTRIQQLLAPSVPCVPLAQVVVAAAVGRAAVAVAVAARSRGQNRRCGATQAASAAAAAVAAAAARHAWAPHPTTRCVVCGCVAVGADVRVLSAPLLALPTHSRQPPTTTNPSARLPWMRACWPPTCRSCQTCWQQSARRSAR
jgi:hypothetical protein